MAKKESWQKGQGKFSRRSTKAKVITQKPRTRLFLALSMMRMISQQSVERGQGSPDG
jgi:hypothetical protein